MVTREEINSMLRQAADEQVDGFHARAFAIAQDAEKYARESSYLDLVRRAKDLQDVQRRFLEKPGRVGPFIGSKKSPGVRMGLHEESERKVAYGMARHAFEAGANAAKHDKSFDYEMGYINAIMDLAAEAGADNLVKELHQMESALIDLLPAYRPEG